MPPEPKSICWSPIPAMGYFTKGSNKQLLAAIAHRVADPKRKIKHFGEVKVIE